LRPLARSAAPSSLAGRATGGCPSRWAGPVRCRQAQSPPLRGCRASGKPCPKRQKSLVLGSRGDSAVLSELPVRVEARLRAGGFVTDVHGLLSEGLGQVCIDSGRREPVGLGLLVGIGIANARDAGHPHRRHAHGAGLPAGIDLATGKVGCPERPAGGPKGVQLGMRCRVVRGSFTPRERTSPSRTTTAPKGRPPPRTLSLASWIASARKWVVVFNSCLHAWSMTGREVCQ